MTHSPDFGAENRRRIWYEKSAPKINRKNTQPICAGGPDRRQIGMTHYCGFWGRPSNFARIRPSCPV